MPTQKDGKWRCDANIGGKPCNGAMRYRRKTNDYACSQCSATYPLSSLTPLQEPEKKPNE